jgi:antitoxin FitA
VVDFAAANGATRARGYSAVNACRGTGHDAIIAIIVNNLEEATVAQLLVRNLPDELVRALKQRAAKRNRSAEQEHREILKAALKGPQRRRLADVLASMPNVGTDEDFTREQTDRR